MDLHTGSPYWFLLHGLRTVAPPLEGETRCDVAVIGAGITGALVAHALVGAGLDVVVLDRRDVGQGSTMASTALLQYDLDVPLHRLIGEIGREDAERAFVAGTRAIARLEMIGREIGSPVDRVPSIYALFDDSAAGAFADEFDCRGKAGLDVRWLDAAGARSDWGIALRAGIVSTQAAVMDPYDFTHALLGHAMGSGARVFDRTGVLEVRPEGDGVRLITDRGATVRAGRVVYATGYEAAEHLEKDAVSLHSTYVFVSEPMSRPARPFMLWEFGDPYIYARWSGDRLIVGGGDVPFVDERRRDRLIERKSRELQRRVGEILPGMLPEIGFSWTGTFASTPDGLGYIGALPGREREFVALGFGGNGITMSALASEIIRDQILGTPNEDARLFRVDRGGAAGRPLGGAGRGVAGEAGRG